MEPRELTKEDIDKVRNIEGFPIGTDEDIIALSKVPYFTVCPNPFIKEFIKENGISYDENTDKYHREPFAADVSEGKNDPIYNAHSYHTKVPYKAIMRYILHYTNPGDIIFDGFCGTGMTGVAAQMCGSDDKALKYQLNQEMKGISWGKRYAILNDLSPAATFIASMYNSKVNITELKTLAENVLGKVRNECGWMYQTKHIVEQYATLFGGGSATGKINYTVWSDVFICPNCGEELVYYNLAFDKSKKSISSSFVCPKCGMKLTKHDCNRAQETKFDDGLNDTVTVAKQVPVLIAYTFGGKKYTKSPDYEDLSTIDKIEHMRIPYWYPIDELPIGYNTEQPKQSHGVRYVHQFYTKRNLYTLSSFYDKCKGTPLQIVLQSISASLCSRLSRYNMGNRGNGPLTGTLYIPSLVAEAEITKLFEGKLKDFIKAFSLTQSFGESIVECSSLTDASTVPDNSIDYIFTDPPFGDNLNYSKLSFTWESWLKIKTQNTTEAIMNKVQGKGLFEYQELMTRCFIQYFRTIKPGRWMTVEFHNSKNAVWNAIQQSLSKAGFVVADVRTLDKKQGSFKQATSNVAVKQDLVISAYKPKDSFTKKFMLEAGNEAAVWDFVRQHLEQVPKVVRHNDKLEVIAERQAFLLFDRMVAYHIMHGISVPIDATNFYKGLDELFLKRDSMYFLPDQVNEYDMARSTCDVENIQFSLFVSDEKSAISWLYQQLAVPQTYSELMPKFMQELKAVDKHEKMPELSVILEENFIKDDEGKWYIPDLTKSGDVTKLREKNLLKEFQGYLDTNGKLKVFRFEAIRAGFSKLWKNKDYKTIVSVVERLPEETIQEDSNLLMYYDISLSRV